MPSHAKGCLIKEVQILPLYASLSFEEQQKVFTKLTATLNIGNLFADVFSRKILAPILTSLEWKSSDITPKIQQASIVDGNIIISWRFPIEFSLEDAEKRAIVLAERKNNLDDLVEEIPKL